MIKAYKKDYPRPQFVRADWENLNGAWGFAFDDTDHGFGSGWQEGFTPQYEILVPYSYESKKSGIGRTEAHPVVWYQRRLGNCCREGCQTILHFEASDYYTQVWVNGRFAGSHTGGYCRFSFDITPYLSGGEDVLVVRVEDRKETWQPRGKQRWKDENFGCWYTQTTGIWKTVWLEWRDRVHLESVRMVPCLESREIDIAWQLSLPENAEGLSLDIAIEFEGRPVNRLTVQDPAGQGSIRAGVRLEKDVSTDVMLWHPEHPHLYDVTFTLRRDGQELDTVQSYFGMRKVHIQDGMVWLNDRPLYQRLVLDQGYWPESGLTPPDEKAIIKDVDCALELGFNGVRKHQKIEDERYYFWCDVKGLLCWCEMPSGYEFGEREAKALLAEWTEVVCQHYNHPSIVTWVPFNESWGIPKVLVSPRQQQLANLLCEQSRVLDGTRPVISNDGWEHTNSDILTLHDYEQDSEVLLERYLSGREEIFRGERLFNGSHRAFATGYAYIGQPVLISEYGGTALQNSEGWGYGAGVKDVDSLVKRYEELTFALKRIPWVCGYCYTQLTDVQQEVNGLLDAERNYKMDPKLIRVVNLRSEEGLRFGGEKKGAALKG